MPAPAPLLDDMLLFVEVVASGGLSAAARRLGLRKSTVSRRLAAMEDRLGVRLLERSSRRLALTEAGRDYHSQCARLVTEAKALNRTVSDARGTPQGTLRIAALPLLAESLAPVVAELLTRHPRLHAEVVPVETHVDLIAEGFDLALRTGPLADSSLVARKLGLLRMVTCASPGYLSQRGAPKTPEALRDHACVLLAPSGTDEVWFFGEGRRAKTIPVHGRLRVADARAGQAAARAGLGLVRLPAFLVADDLRAGLLVPVLESESPAGVPLYAVYPSSRQLAPKVRAFLDLLATRGAALPWDASPQVP